MATFSLDALSIHDNPSGWGPTSDNTPKKFENVPYSPLTFSVLHHKQQQQQQQQQLEQFKLGRIADWTAPQGTMTYGAKKYTPRGAAAAPAAAAAATDDAVADAVPAATSAFSIASTATGRAAGGAGGASSGWSHAVKQTRQRTGAPTGGAQSSSMQFGAGSNVSGRGGRYGQQHPANRRGMPFSARQQAKRSQNIYAHTLQNIPALPIGKSWVARDKFEFERLKKLSVKPSMGEKLASRSYGSILPYESAYDALSTKKSRPLEITSTSSLKKVFSDVTTSDDPVMREIADEQEENAPCTVYVTDQLLSVLMASTRSVYPWDLIVEKQGNQIFIDKRPGNDDADLLTVNETAKDPQPFDEGVNSISSLRQEATFVNRAFAQQVLKKGAERKAFGDKGKQQHPLVENRSEEEIAPVGYMYKRWKLSEQLNIVVRCEVDGSIQRQGYEEQYVTIRALNEFSSVMLGTSALPGTTTSGSIGWRQNMDAQRAAVLVTEFKNNSNKFARWMAQAMLAGCEQFRLGFVSRKYPKSRLKHDILAVERLVPSQFTSQMDLSYGNMWAIVKTILDAVIKCEEDGKYVLIKETNKTTIRLFYVPSGSLEDENDQGDSDEEAQSVDSSDLVDDL